MRAAAAVIFVVVLGAVIGPVAAVRGGRSPAPYVQPGCTVMFMPGEECVLEVGPGARGCCVPGFTCGGGSNDGGGDGGGKRQRCEPAAASELTYGFAAARGAVAGAADAYEAGKALEAAVASAAALNSRAAGGGAGGAGGWAATTTTGGNGGGCPGAAAEVDERQQQRWCAERRLLPGDACDPSASPAVECCPDGFSCAGGEGEELRGFRCRLAVTASALSAATEPLAPAAAKSPALRAAIAATATAAAAAQCPGDGQEEDPLRAGTADAVAAAASPAAAAATAALLPFPPPPLPADACSCRVDSQGRRVPAPCPSAWDLTTASDAGAAAAGPPPALRINTKMGVLELDPPTSSSPPPLARLHGINWFGWETGQKNFDGLWAYCDDQGDSGCPPGAQIPPSTDSAVSSSDRDRMRAYYWGKRTATNDFAAVVHAIQALGFNAVRVPFTFAELAASLPATSDGRAAGELALCLRDDLDALNFQRLADPLLDQGALRAAVAGGNQTLFPRYGGAPHPPPARFWPSDPAARAQCDLPWEAPLKSGFVDPSRGDATLRLTTCNWYLPQAPGTAAIHRFLFQIEYLVSRGMYVVLSYHPTAPRDATTADASLFAANWGNLWRSLAALPSYSSRLRGRVLPDLLNEGSRYGCMYERAAVAASGEDVGAPTCALAARAMAAAAAAVRSADPNIPGVLFNGVGQSGTPTDVAPGGDPNCVAAGTCFEGMPWGDGYITRRASFNAARGGAPKASNASAIFAPAASSSSGGSGSSSSGSPRAIALASMMALAPHAYPSSITGWGLSTQQPGPLHARFNASWGLKAAGKDALYRGTRLRVRPPVLLGEIGVRDDGDNGPSAPNADTTSWRAEDVAWLRDVRRYFESRFLRVRAVRASRGRPGRAASSYPFSWFFWSYNANSADTKGLVGPNHSWRVVQWTKVRGLTAELGLRPWYCDFAPAGFCGGAAAASATASA